MANVSMRDRALELVYGLMYDQFAMVPVHTNMKNFTEDKGSLVNGHYTVDIERKRDYKAQWFVSIKVLTHTQEFINFCHEHGFSNSGSDCLFLHYYSNTEWSFRYMSDDIANYSPVVIAKLDR